MSYRLGQSKARFNFSQSTSGDTATTKTHGQEGSHGSTLPSGSSLFSGPTTSGIVHSSTFFTNHGSKHKGHRRGHSYGGVINPPSIGLHHHLESRPSHPNTHHGMLPSQTGGTISNSVHKGHRRTLSGCLPMVGMGAVAWSSLRDLESSSNLQGHAHSPATIFSPEVSRPSSPELLDAEGKSTPTCDDGTKKDFVDTTDDLDSVECGLGPCRLPECFQGLANIQFFVSILALLVTLQQAVASGYVNSVITTIETRFEIPSRFSGLIASSYEMGNVVTVLFVSYLGAKRHIPRWIAIGVFTMVIGCVVFTLPHFLSSDKSTHSYLSSSSYNTERLVQFNDSDVTSLFNDTSNANKNGSTVNMQSLRQVDYKPISKASRNAICRSANPHSSRFISGKTFPPPSMENTELTLGSPVNYPTVKQEYMSFGCSFEIIGEDGKKTVSNGDSYGHPLILFMLAQLLLGCGGSPLFTLGITYVDDHVPAESSSVYIGIVYSMAAFGPVLGFLLGAWLLSIPSAPVGNPDEQFIGLWWGGFMVAGGLLFITSLPFLTLPRLVKPHKASKEEEIADSSCGGDGGGDTTGEITTVAVAEEGSNAAYGQSIKDIPRSIWRLITNPTYVVTCLGGCMELNIVSGFVVFLPKYLETQFSLGKPEASLFTGGIAIPGACLGIFAGGYLMKRLQLKPSGAAKFVVITNILCLVGYVLFFFLGCPNPNIAGATLPYPGTEDLPGSSSFTVNLTSPCNSDCSCDSSLDAQYVCHNGVTYFSPCHAGCSVDMTQCSCAGGESVTPNLCADKPCKTLLPFMIVLFFMTGTVAVTQMPLLMIVLRSVTPQERSFALGMQFVIFRIFGYIPSPIVFGNVIDSACLLWSVKRCSSLLPAVSGRCLLYDVQDFRYKYVGMLSGLKLLALALFLYDLFHLRRLEKREAAAITPEKNEGVNKMSSNSVISLNNLFEDPEAPYVTTPGADIVQPL